MIVKTSIREGSLRALLEDRLFVTSTKHLLHLHSCAGFCFHHCSIYLKKIILRESFMNVFVNIMPRFETFINNCFVKAFINLSAGKKSKVERPREGGGKLNIIKERIIYCSHAAAKTHFSKTFKDRASLMHSNLILGIRTTIPWIKVKFGTSYCSSLFCCL